MYLSHHDACTFMDKQLRQQRYRYDIKTDDQLVDRISAEIIRLVDALEATNDGNWDGVVGALEIVDQELLDIALYAQLRQHGVLDIGNARRIVAPEKKRRGRPKKTTT